MVMKLVVFEDFVFSQRVDFFISNVILIFSCFIILIGQDVMDRLFGFILVENANALFTSSTQVVKHLLDHGLLLVRLLCILHEMRILNLIKSINNCNMKEISLQSLLFLHFHLNCPVKYE